MLPNTFNIKHHATILKLKAAQKYNISPDKCHIGHLTLQGLLDRPDFLNQIDAVTDEGETNISVARRSCLLASAMQKYGLQPGDSVVLMGLNHLDLVIPFYACHFNGLSVCCIDPNCALADLQVLLPNIKPKIIFCQKLYEEKIKEALAVNNLKRDTVIFDDKAVMKAFISQQKGTETNFRPAEFDQFKTNAWLLLTSGTTGIPKVAVIPYDTLLNAVFSWMNSELFSNKCEKVLLMGTLQWVTTAGTFIAGPLRSYTRIQSSRRLTPADLVAFINKYKPNQATAPPFLMEQVLEAAENGSCDLSSFISIGLAGCSVEKSFLRRFRKLCPRSLYLVYGMTELLVPIFEFKADTPEHSIGYPKDKYQFKLVDDDGHDIERPYIVGELWVKGDDFFKGYLNNPQETRKMLTEDGWLMTGDLFQRNEQNYYYFIDRKRLLIKYRGILISPLQIEEVIKLHPSVQEACVVGIPDLSSMELPIAAIQRRNDEKLDPEDIFRLLKKSLPDNKQLHGGLFFVDSIPTLSTGKPNRTKMREIALTSLRILPKCNLS